MRKLLKGIALALLPVAAYFALFIAFEPNNYFGLKAKADGTDIMATLRQYQESPTPRIILGDSRTAKFDPALLQELTGNEWANLSYGGASLEEQLDILEWALATQPDMEEVLFMASFYPFNKSYNHNRSVVAASQNPLQYITNLGYNINMLTNLLAHLSPGQTVGAEGETEDPANYQYVDYTSPLTGETVSMRDTMARHLGELTPKTEGWALNTEQLARLLEIIYECRERGIGFTVVLPPASPEVLDYLVKPLHIEEGMQPALAALEATGAPVLDYEFGENGLADDQFYDGFHLDMERGLQAWTRQLFADMGYTGEVAAHGA